jgi:hypothetical protein
VTASANLKILDNKMNQEKFLELSIQNLSPSPIDIRAKYIRNELLEGVIRLYHESLNESAMDEKPISIEALNEGIKFINLFPFEYIDNKPDLLKEPSGALSYDWETEDQKNSFAISINGTGYIAYAGVFSDNSEVDGKEPFNAEKIPSSLLFNILKVFKHL